MIPVANDRLKNGSTKMKVKQTWLKMKLTLVILNQIFTRSASLEVARIFLKNRGTPIKEGFVFQVACPRPLCSSLLKDYQVSYWIFRIFSSNMSLSLYSSVQKPNDNDR